MNRIVTVTAAGYIRVNGKRGAWEAQKRDSSCFLSELPDGITVEKAGFMANVTIEIMI